MAAGAQFLHLRLQITLVSRLRVVSGARLRYTTIKSGRRRLLVPNSAFITREFMVLDDGPSDMGPGPWDRPQVEL